MAERDAVTASRRRRAIPARSMTSRPYLREQRSGETDYESRRATWHQWQPVAELAQGDAP